MPRLPRELQKPSDTKIQITAMAGRAKEIVERAKNARETLLDADMRAYARQLVTLGPHDDILPPSDDLSPLHQMLRISLTDSSPRNRIRAAKILADLARDLPGAPVVAAGDTTINILNMDPTQAREFLSRRGQVMLPEQMDRLLDAPLDVQGEPAEVTTETPETPPAKPQK